MVAHQRRGGVETEIVAASRVIEKFPGQVSQGRRRHRQLDAHALLLVVGQLLAGAEAAEQFIAQEKAKEFTAKVLHRLFFGRGRLAPSPGRMQDRILQLEQMTFQRGIGKGKGRCRARLARRGTNGNDVVTVSVCMYFNGKIEIIHGGLP